MLYHGSTPEWRYDVDAYGTIFRGRPYSLQDYDHWIDGEMATGFVGFYTGNWRNSAAILDDSKWNENADDSERVLKAWIAAENWPETAEPHGRSAARRAWEGQDALTRAFRRCGLAGYVMVQPYSGDEYVIGYWLPEKDLMNQEAHRDARRETHNYVEAYMTGDVWRLEVQEWENGDWVMADDVSEEWIGDEIESAWEREFPLTEFPAERVAVKGDD